MQRICAPLLLGLMMSLSNYSYAAEPVKEQEKKSVNVEMVTNKGTMILELDAEKAPKSTANFIEYVKAGHYDGTIFHRVIKGFMIQGGGFQPGMAQKPTRAPIENEANNGLKNVTGSIAMARTNDPQSATAQFFINAKDNSFLDYTSPTPQGWGYAVFGKVSQGIEVMQAIEGVATTNKGGMGDVPVEDVVIEKVTIKD